MTNPKKKMISSKEAQRLVDELHREFVAAHRRYAAAFVMLSEAIERENKAKKNKKRAK
jgi:hypothetical protein